MLNKRKNLPLVSIVIPTLNSKEDLLKCLYSIRSLDYPKEDIEVIILDNGSTDGTREEMNQIFMEMKKEGWHRLNMILSKENLGVYTSRDELFKLFDPRAEYILSLDDDVSLPTDSLSTLLGSLEGHSEWGIIGPRTVYARAQDETAHGAGFVNLWTGHYSEIDAANLIECDYVIGCCMLIKKEVISELKGFDRDYFTSHGEVDFCLKAKKRGYKVFYEPKVEVKHNVAKGGTKTLERLYYLHRNKFLIIKKNIPFPKKIVSLFILIFIASIKNIVQSLFTRARISEIRIILLALLDGATNRWGKTDRKFHI